MLLATTVTLETATLCSLLSAAIVAGGAVGLKYLPLGARAKARVAEQVAAAQPELCQSHGERLTKIETELKITLPAITKQMSELSADVRTGLHGVHQRLDQVLDGRGRR